MQRKPQRKKRDGMILDGRVSAVVGTHTPRADGGRAYPSGGHGVSLRRGHVRPYGFRARAGNKIVARFITNLPVQFPVAKGR